MCMFRRFRRVILSRATGMNSYRQTSWHTGISTSVTGVLGLLTFLGELRHHKEQNVHRNVRFVQEWLWLLGRREETSVHVVCSLWFR